MCSKRRSSHRVGFSLVELMVVIVIIGLLASAVTIGVRSYMSKGRTARIQLDFAKIEEALDSFYTFNGRYPNNQEGIEVLALGAGDENERLLKSIPEDPWGNRYEYVNPGPGNEPYEVICLGADGREGGSGDGEDVSNIALRAGS